LLTATKRTLKLLLVTVVTVGFLGFSIVNRQTVHISLFPLPYSADLPQFLFAMLCFTCGVTVGWVTLSLKLSHLKRLFKAEHRRAIALQNELDTTQTIMGRPHPLPTVPKA